jgi:glyoxylase-like metal-dependent hydrolase (beta-lactamase superfamily II)
MTRWGGVVVSGLGHERSAVLAEIRELVGRAQEHREFIVPGHGPKVWREPEKLAIRRTPSQEDATAVA